MNNEEPVPEIVSGFSETFRWNANLLRRLLPWMPATACLAVMTLAVLWDAPAPVQASSHARREAGAALFHERGCEYCHGVGGVGTARAPRLTTIGKTWKKPQLQNQILNGGHEMPPFRDALQKDEVKSLVAYLSAQK